MRTQVIADAVLCRPDTLRNYKSVEEDLEEANIELDRYATLGYMKRVPLKEAEREFSGGTVSRLGLVLKIKDDGQKKRRIVIDLRRSGGNAKSVLPEKLVLPRLTDGVKLIKESGKGALRRQIQQENTRWNWRWWTCRTRSRCCQWRRPS